MKKVFYTSLLFIFFFGTVSGGNITVTSPGAGTTWNIGVEYKIEWNEAPKDHQRVKIRLFNSSGTTKILDIANDTDNDGLLRWTIPASVTQGQYVIRVKTLDNQESDDSGIFNIGQKTFAPMRVEAQILQIDSPDLKISIQFNPVSPVVEQNTAVKFKVENIGPGDSKATSIRVFMGQTNTDTWPVPILKQGRSYSVTKKLNPPGVGYILWAADVDHNNAMGDKNRENNFVSKKMIIRGSDLIVCISSGRRPAVGSKSTIRAEVKNIGKARSKSCKLRIYAKQKSVTYHNIPELDPGDTFAVTRSHRWGLSGTKEITAFVDYYQKVKESNEKNNAVEGSYFVRLPHHDRYAVGFRTKCSDGTNTY